MDMDSENSSAVPTVVDDNGELDISAVLEFLRKRNFKVKHGPYLSSVLLNMYLISHAVVLSRITRSPSILL